MKVKVVTDEGKVVSLGYMDQPYNIEDGVAFSFGPVTDGGQTSTEIDLPDEYVDRPLTDVTVGDFVKRLESTLRKRK